MAMKRILVGLDGSALAETVLGTVRELARRVGADVLLAHVTHVPASFRAEADLSLDEVVARERRDAESYLRRLARELGEAGVTVRTVVAAGDPATEIVRMADGEGVDLVALATHGRSGMQRWLHGSVADAVLHATTRPLLLFRPTLEATRAAAYAVQRVIVPLDGSPLAEEALPLARELARALEVPLELLRVVELLDLAFAADPYGGFYLDYPRVVQALEEGATTYLAAAAERERRHGLTVETTMVTGAAADAIAHHVKARSGGLLVLGTHGRSGWRAAVIGSVARRVTLLAETPVLLVRPAAAEGGAEKRS